MLGTLDHTCRVEFCKDQVGCDSEFGGRLLSYRRVADEERGQKPRGKSYVLWVQASLEVKIGGHDDHIANGHVAGPGQHEHHHIGDLRRLDQTA